MEENHTRAGFWRVCRIGVWHYVLALTFLVVIAFARAPYRQIPDALFVSDGFGYYIYLPSVVLDRDLDFSNQLNRVPYEAAKEYFDPVPATGLRANPFPIGAALLWLPFFLLGHGTALVLRALGFHVPLSGFGFVYELPTYCGAFLYGFTGLWLIGRMISEVFTRRIADITVLAMLCATPYAYYLWLEPDVSHVMAAFAIALFLYGVWRAMRDRDERLVAWMANGAALGIVALVRPYNGLVGAAALPAVLYIARSRGRGFMSAIVPLAVCAVTSLIVFVPQGVVATLLYGRLTFLPPGTKYDQMMWTRPDVTALAISTLSFFPALIFAFYGLVAAGWFSRPVHAHVIDARDAFLRWVRPVGVVGLMAVLYIIASYPRGSTFGDSFGQRRIVDWVPLLSIGFAAGFAAIPERHRSKAVGAALALVVLGLVLSALYTLKLLPQWGMAGRFA